MKGIVFTEFLEMVEERFGPAVADKIIVNAALPTGGVYTSVGTYDHRELVALVMQLSKETAIAPPVLIRTFGQHLFKRFHDLYPPFFNGVTCAFDFLANVDGYIHPEVRKLYPDAELPRFNARRIENGGMELLYYSSRHFGDLAEGLILGCVEHFGEKVNLRREPTVDADGKEAVRFTLNHLS